MKFRDLFSSLISDIRPLPSGFGAQGVRKHRTCGAILVVGGGGWQNAQLGVETDELALGINIKSYERRYYLPINSKLPNNFGEPRARSFTDDWSTETTIEGEMIGPPDVSIATACEIANDRDILGTGAGDDFLDELTDRQTRGDWRMFTFRLSSDPLISSV